MASSCLIVIVTVLVCAAWVDSLKLPSYFKPCSRNDPDINSCVLKNGRLTFTQLMKRGGDKKYNIPYLTPLSLTELTIEQDGLKLVLKNVKVYGLENAQLTRAKVDFKAKREEFDLTVPKFELLCDYSIAGRILLLPIHGSSGPANFTIPNLKLHVSHNYVLKILKSGQEHMVTKISAATFDKTSGFITFANLFGDKELSDNMNLLINENSEDVIGEVGPAVVEALAQVIEQIYNGLTSVVPFDEMYPEKL